MSIDNKNLDGGLPNLEVLPANEIVTDRHHAWHALRGYDFAGLENILVDGISPARNQGDYAVCLSASPAVAHSVGREANSFYQYTLQNSLSVSVLTGSDVFPKGNYNGFTDELRQNAVRPSDIDGVLLPSDTVNQRLVDVATVHEARQPEQAIAFIWRTLKHLSDLGAEVDPSTTEVAEAAIEISERGDNLDVDTAQHLEKAFMKSYADHLQTMGVQEPTVGDMLGVVLARVDRGDTVSVYAFDKALKDEIGRANGRIVSAAMNHHHLGRTGLYYSDIDYYYDRDVPLDHPY